MNTIYINPPVGDPTCPYCSLYHLKSFVEKNSDHHMWVRDSNIEFLDYLIRNYYTSKFQQLKAELISNYEKKPELQGIELFHYYKLKNPNINVTEKEIQDAFSILKSEKFYDSNDYVYAINRIGNWLELASSIAYPADYSGFKLNFGIYRCREKIDDLTEPLTKTESLFFEDYVVDELFPFIEEKRPRCIGISVPMKHQIYFAILLARLIRDRYPDIKLVAGGTYIHHIYKQTSINGDVNDLRTFFDIFDFFAVGEGEIPTVELLNCIELNQDCKNQKNLVYCVENGVTRLEDYFVHKLDECPKPDYYDVLWSKYLSPHKMICYVPTRGCYWGKCSFCDYGLNKQSATTDWRCKNIEKVVSDLKELSEITKFIYMSVDAIAPSWLLRLSDRLIEENIQICWDAEIRLDKYYSFSDALRLKKGGCIAISVGIESADDEIITRINKGYKPYMNVKSLRNLHDAGIGIFPMTFIGFPGETYTQAIKTIEFLDENQELFALVPAPSLFYLEGASDISKNYKDYGIDEKKLFPNLEITNGWFWRTQGINKDELRLLYHKISEVCGENNLVTSRPFMSVDTPHSMMYLSHHGVNALKQFRTAGYEFRHEQYVISPFQLEEITNLQKIIREKATEYYLRGFYPTKKYIDSYLNDHRFIVKKMKTEKYKYDTTVNDQLSDWENEYFSRNAENFR